MKPEMPFRVWKARKTWERSHFSPRERESKLRSMASRCSGASPTKSLKLSLSSGAMLKNPSSDFSRAEEEWGEAKAAESIPKVSLSRFSEASVMIWDKRSRALSWGLPDSRPTKIFFAMAWISLAQDPQASEALWVQVRKRLA